MAVTLLEAKKNTQDAIVLGVIDEFAKSSFLLKNMPFDDAVSPSGNGASLTYGYTRLFSQPSAAFRAVNTEYAPQEVDKKRFTVDLKVFGGSFEIDRVIAGMGGVVNEVTLQMQQKIKAAKALFNHSVINGDSAVDTLCFDGLEKALIGSSTEFNAGGTVIDLSTSAKVDENYKVFLDKLDEFLADLDGKPSALMVNSKLYAKIKACARRASAYNESMDEFGQQISMYDQIPIVDMGDQPGSVNPVISVNGTGETSLYAARFNVLDGFHGVSMAGQPIVRTWMPDYSIAGAVKKGEVEMVAAVALKATKAAGVFRKIKIK